MVAASTSADSAAYDRCMCDLRKGSSAGTEPWLTSVKRCPHDTTAMPRRSTPRGAAGARRTAGAILLVATPWTLATKHQALGTKHAGLGTATVAPRGVVTPRQLPPHEHAGRL